MSIGQIHERATENSDSVQQRLGKEFTRVEAYQYNPASIRIRVVDERFRNMAKLDRIDLIEPFLDQFPEPIQQQLIFVLCMAPGEETDPDFWALNREFEDTASAPDLL